MVQKAVNTETKVGLRSSIMVGNFDFRCSRSCCPSNNITTKVQTQKTIIKNFHPKEAKTKDSKPTLFYTNAAEPSKQKKKTKKTRKRSLNTEKSRKTPRQLVTILLTSQKKDGDKTLVRSRISTVIKKVNRPATTLNFQKTSISLDNLCVNDW